MSSPAQAGPSAPKEKKEKGATKMVRRFSTMLKKADPSKRLSFLRPKDKEKGESR